MSYRKIIAVSAGLGILVALSAGACQPGQTHDLEGVTFYDVEKPQGFNNVDQHPNLVRFCIDGVAFVTTSRQGDAVLRVPEWDVRYCGGAGK